MRELWDGFLDASIWELLAELIVEIGKKGNRMKNLINTSLPRELLKITLLIFVMALALIGCAPAAPAISSPTAIPSLTPEIHTATSEAQVQRVEIQISNANPPQVNAVVSGNLTESCAVLGESQVQYASSVYQIAVYVVSPTDIGCAPVTTPFESTIPLNINGLPAGTYNVIANGVNAVFTLPVENPTPSPVPTAIVAPVNQNCTDSAAFVSDVTVPDNTVVASNTAFTKTWKLKNTGTCTWDSSYLIANISGAAMSQQPGYWIVQQGQTVPPNQTVDISVGMTSPVDNGNYVSYWGLKKVDGQFMPVEGGANGNSFYVKIKVNNGAISGNITAQSISIELEQGSGVVCTANSTYLIHASITADGPTTTSYEVSSTAGQIAAGYLQDRNNNLLPYINDSVVFEQAGTQTINLRFVGPYPYPDDITINLRVNGGEWHNVKLACQ